ncbi:MAG: homoserine kinase [Coriobacteriia bacterium]|nr:homoserine kinase [Coriobacteriia bacterium]
MASVTVRVPATSANLGSGYDSFGLALALHNTVSAELSLSGEWHVQVLGEGENDEAVRRDNRVVEAMVRLFAEAGRPDEAAHVFCRNDVPIGRGLGSSSAALVGGLVAANELMGAPFGPPDIFRMAAELEGHPDNVAAALSGGFTMCWRDRSFAFARIEPAAGLAAVCVVSDEPLSTSKARELLPAAVPHEDAAFNVGRAGLLTAGIALGRADLIGPGMRDRLHEPYRLAAVPDLDTVAEALVIAGADGAALSGSGPTVIGLVSAADDGAAVIRGIEVASRVAELLAHVPGRRTPFVVAVDRSGATLTG